MKYATNSGIIYTKVSPELVWRRAFSISHMYNSYEHGQTIWCKTVFSFRSEYSSDRAICWVIQAFPLKAKNGCLVLHCSALLCKSELQISAKKGNVGCWSHQVWTYGKRSSHFKCITLEGSDWQTAGCCHWVNNTCPALQQYINCIVSTDRYRCARYMCTWKSVWKHICFSNIQLDWILEGAQKLTTFGLLHLFSLPDLCLVADLSTPFSSSNEHCMFAGGMQGVDWGAPLPLKHESKTPEKSFISGPLAPLFLFSPVLLSIHIPPQRSPVECRA